MTKPRLPGFAARLLAGAALLAVSQPALARDLPDLFPAGVDAEGAACRVTRDWSTQTGSVRIASRQRLVITCGGNAQPAGYLLPPSAVPEKAAASVCAEPHAAALSGLGQADVRRCYDAWLGRDAVEISIDGWRGAAVSRASGPLVAALHAARARDASMAKAGARPIDLTGFAAPPAAADAGQRTASDDAGLDPAAAVRSGLSAIYAGRNVEASQFLNDALAQLAGAPPIKRAELRLTAGLADSNIGEFAAADGHFREANGLLGSLPPSQEVVALRARARVYQALHLVNQNRWRTVLTLLEDQGPQTAPRLDDAALLARLNQPAAAEPSGGPDLRQALQSSLDATFSNNQDILLIQQELAASTAHVRLGETDQASVVLDRAVQRARALDQRLRADFPGSAGTVNWLRARLERQRARIAVAQGRFDDAVLGFDCALAIMEARGQQGSGCLFAEDPGARGERLAGPVIAEAQLERAAALEAKPGVDRHTVLADYGAAVDTLASASSTVAAPSPLLGRYLDMLAQNSRDGDQQAADHFLRALQTVREPGIAREFVAVQRAAAFGPQGEALRHRGELERRAGQLRVEIAGLAAGDPRLAEARAERDRVASELEQVRGTLASSGRYADTGDEPVPLDAIRRALRPGEIYWKLADVGGRLFGAVITPSRTMVYTVAGTTRDARSEASAVLDSARSVKGADGRARLFAFATARAYRLFTRVAGPAAQEIASAQSVVEDTGGVLAQMPIAVLVTAPSAAATRADADYSAVPFLARRAQIASALSPASFVVARTGGAPSNAPQPFIGFGETAQAATPSASVADAPVPLGAACRIRYADWVSNYNSYAPIPATEIRDAALALGVPNAPVVTGDAFTDVSVVREGLAGDLEKFQIIHFATHGFPATPKSDLCATPIPPSLVTSIQPPDPAQGSGTPVSSDGFLTYIDIARLRLDANLVVLSACETASSVDSATARLGGQEGSNLTGLVRAFIAARARAVIATSWRVSATQGTQELVDTFYRSGRTETIGAALHDAQMTVASRRATSHPYFWAAFFLVGDGAKTMLTSPRAVATGPLPGAGTAQRTDLAASPHSVSG